MGQLALRLHVGDTVYIGAAKAGETEEAWQARTGWVFERVVMPHSIMEMKSPDGRMIKIYEDRGTELVPHVIAFVGVTPASDGPDATVTRVVFRAPKEIPILRAGAQRVRQ